MKIGYIRVSTKEQNIERQLDRLNEAGCEKIFIDKRSGKDMGRPELQKMLEQLRKEDSVVITELSRLGRSLKDIIQLTTEFSERDVNLTVLDIPWLDTSTPSGKYFFMSMALLDELRRDIIVQNTKDGLEAARARGRKGGRPPVDQTALKTALTMYFSKKHTIKEITKMTGISQGTLYTGVHKKSVE